MYLYSESSACFKIFGFAILFGANLEVVRESDDICSHLYFIEKGKLWHPLSELLKCSLLVGPSHSAFSGSLVKDLCIERKKKTDPNSKTFIFMVLRSWDS